MLKHQQFKDSESDMTELRVSKCQRVDKHDNEKGYGLDKYEGEDEDKRLGYVFVLFIDSFSLFQKESNCLTDLGKIIKSLTTLQAYQKLANQIITNFALDFPSRWCLKTKKKIILAACKRVWNPTWLLQL